MLPPVTVWEWASRKVSISSECGLFFTVAYLIELVFADFMLSFDCDEDYGCYCWLVRYPSGC